MQQMYMTLLLITLSQAHIEISNWQGEFQSIVITSSCILLPQIQFPDLLKPLLVWKASVTTFSIVSTVTKWYSCESVLVGAFIAW